jgi:hypothetical protein
MSISTNDLDLIHDFAILTYMKGDKGLMYKNSHRVVYYKALNRVHKRGRELFDAQVAELDYAHLKQQVLDFELQHPSVVK